MTLIKTSLEASRRLLWAGVPALEHLRQFKSALKITWVRPEKIPCIKPKVSGDLAPLGAIDLKQLPSTFMASEELKSADELVKRVHTLEFFPRTKLLEEFLMIYRNRVKSHRLDDDSIEVRMAELTCKIRNLQIHMDKFPKDKVNKVRLKEMIDKRNRHLEILRHNDYKKYEWLLEKLDVMHKVFKCKTHERVERKKSLRRLTMLYIEKLKYERLAEYKSFLEAQKEGFLKAKLEKLLWIKKTEEECGVPPTVTDADLERVRDQLSSLQIVQTKTITE